MPRGKKNPLYALVSDRLVRLRAATELSQKALAELADLTDPAVSAIERGEAVSKISTIERLASALGVSPVYLGFGPDGALRWRERHSRFGLDADPPPEPEPARRAPLDLYKGMAARLREARTAKALSMRELERKVECSASAISLLEAGKSVVLLSTCEELAKALDVAPGWLAYGLGDGPAQN